MSIDIIAAPVRVRPKGEQIPKRTVRLPPEGLKIEGAQSLGVCGIWQGIWQQQMGLEKIRYYGGLHLSMMYHILIIFGKE